MTKETAFDQEQYKLAYPDGIEHHYWYIARTRIIYTEIKKAGLEQAKFLEIGCGKGTVIKLLKDKLDIKGVELANIEPDEDVKAWITHHTDAIDLDEDFRNSIEVIMLLDVIEHIEDPVAFLQNIQKHFPNATHFIITVPARPELWSNYDEYYGHFKRYDLNDFTKLSQQLQLKSILTNYFFHTLYPPGRLVMQFKKERNLKFTAPTGLGKIIHCVLSIYLYCEYKILPKKIYGTSVLSILEK